MNDTASDRPLYSPARRIPAGPYSDLIILSGAICQDTDAKNKIELQTERIFQHFTRVLRELGGDFADIVKTTTYLIDLADYPAFNDVRRRFLANFDQAPASTAVGVGSLIGDGTLIEIEAMALVHRELTK